MSKILLVEDNPDTVELVKILLKDKVIDSAGSCEEALLMLSEGKYSLLLIDVKLPDFTGTYLAERARQDKDLPIAFLTNYHTRSTREAATELQASYWLKGDMFNDPLKFQSAVDSIERY